jgi:3-hydroxyisobutyrate dehydrogenase-like beta-hydroxyacid dehydrogenase
MTKTSVTVIGLGLMGSALARALSAANLEVTVWNRSPSKAQLFEPGTVKVADTIVDAVQASNIIIVCIRDYDATDELFRVGAVENELAKKVIVQLSTGTPAKAREASIWASTIGAAYLDGEIMAFPDAIGTATGAIIYAGNASSFEACKTVVDAFGGTAQLIGDDPGMAAALSNAILSIYFSFVFGALNGAAICDAEKVPLPLFRDLGVSLLPVFGDVLSRSVDMITTDTYQSKHSTLDTSAGALAQIAAVGEGAGLDGRFIDCMRMYATEAIEAGCGSLGNAALFKLFRKE